MEQIKTFEDACNKLGINPEEIKITLPKEMEAHAKALEAHSKLVVIAEALNDGWKPDWKNWDEPKYYPWFEMGSPSGGGFSYYGCGGWAAVSVVGSRLCFKSADLAKHVGNLFIDDYRDFLTLNIE